jgi:2-polyprenyl-3-methyl-5-hydroxy-6-metoxy-1,4-benzoquinol methylase
MTLIKHSDGLVHAEPSSSGRTKVSVDLLNKNVFMPAAEWETDYPLDLIKHILESKGLGYLCDEMMREESPSYVRHSLENDILGYVSQDAFCGKTILDFGCGCGSSTMVLARMFPNSEIVGVELVHEYLSVCEHRAEFYGYDNVKFLLTSNPNTLPEGLKDFDYIILSAVYEHLLPGERTMLLPVIWSHLKPGGTLFINQTPNILFPFESHTSNLPLINYLPDSSAMRLAKRFSRRISQEETWETLLRRGIRGGSLGEIIKILSDTGELPILLEPTMPGIKDRIDLWYRASKAAGASGVKRIMKYLFKFAKSLTGYEFVPSLSLAVQKQCHV